MDHLRQEELALYLEQELRKHYQIRFQCQPEKSLNSRPIARAAVCKSLSCLSTSGLLGFPDNRNAARGRDQFVQEA